MSYDEIKRKYAAYRRRGEVIPEIEHFIDHGSNPDYPHYDVVQQHLEKITSTNIWLHLSLFVVLLVCFIFLFRTVKESPFGIESTNPS